MNRVLRFAAAALAALLPLSVAAPATAQQTAAPAEQRTPVTILISIDGFRADYLDRGITPMLSALAKQGVHAPMRPSFPSKTFPNHYTLVTGLRPDRNGITANRMEDARKPGKVFTMGTFDPFWWDEAEPIWVTAEKAGIRTGVLYWPGAQAKIRGVRPSDWQGFFHDMPDENRINSILDWLRRPAEIRPRFLTLYINTIDDVGHDNGPDSPEIDAALTAVDAQIGRLTAGLAELGQPANLVIVSDHGMAAISEARSIDLAAIADPADFRAIEDGPFASLEPVEGHEAALAKALTAPHDHMQCWPRAEIPARFHYGHNPRVPAWFCLADTGWEIRAKAPEADWKVKYGNHGWDNDAPEMRALFIAEGPAFRSGVTLPVFDNVDVYPLLCDLIGIAPVADVDGTDAVFRRAMAR